ncbi:MAG: M67 family metallopeptidase [Candidatus Bathyarchaeota archaeon]|nr:MAG: M67 family metallopeptidase [Candidatus Bathyarchaeota archaeon]
MTLILSEMQIKLLRAEVEKSFPLEACALLFGEHKEDVVTVDKVIVASNILESTTRFEVDPTFVAFAFEQAEKEGLDFIGLFHSHPAPATPSAIDVRYMKLWGSAVWLILSTLDGEIAAFRKLDDQTERVEIEIK